MVPGYATAGALLYVAVLMTDGLADIDWSDITDIGTCGSGSNNDASIIFHRQRYRPGIYNLYADQVSQWPPRRGIPQCVYFVWLVFSKVYLFINQSNNFLGGFSVQQITPLNVSALFLHQSDNLSHQLKSSTRHNFGKPQNTSVKKPRPGLDSPRLYVAF